VTHAEFLDLTTPQAYKAPSADLTGLAVWTAAQLAKKKRGDGHRDRKDE